MTARDAEGESWRSLLDQQLSGQLDAVWGKSCVDGRPMLLLQHLFDAMAVAEVVWDEFLAPGVRARWNEVAPDAGGRRFVAWLVGIHDIGKATPAFQSYDRRLWERVSAAGLRARQIEKQPRQWRHDIAGARIVRDASCEGGLSPSSAEWIWPLVAGHHGVVKGTSALQTRVARPNGHGRLPAWHRLQSAVLEIVTLAAGYEGLEALRSVRSASRADQLAMSGTIILCDWIASNEEHFEGVDRLESVSVENARRRASRAWRELGIAPGWRELGPVGGLQPFEMRFAREPRPSQRLVVEAASKLPGSGLVIVEAPVGEGKTEAAFAAAELLAARTGADGVFIGMPTQATADPMLERVLQWTGTYGEQLEVALLHGKRSHNKVWQQLQAARDAATSAAGDRERDVSEADRDKYGVADDFESVISGVDEVGGDGTEQRAASAFLEGPKLGLFAPFVVATIDQLLFAATRTRHVALRFAGLTGKVVVLDEVHAADVYMNQFLTEALRWLGQASVPVVLLSATLSPSQRGQLTQAYLEGMTGKADAAAEIDVADTSYPRVTTVGLDANAQPAVRTQSTDPWRPAAAVAIDLLPEGADDEPGALVADLLAEKLASGGCALVLRNTVRRARETYAALKKTFGSDVVLLHARLSVEARADRAEELVSELGPPGRGARPQRRIVVATQVAEQSFDIDADLLVTDIAPVDLLVQRLGRVHRHERPAQARPVHLQHPAMIVTGCGPLMEDQPPWLDSGASHVYGTHRLLRTAALLLDAVRGGGWQLPTQVPELVRLVYGDDPLVPPGWKEAADRAQQDDETERRERTARAEQFVLGKPADRASASLAGLHVMGTPVAEDDAGRVVVRDGEPSAEVQFVVRTEGGYRTLHGVWLGRQGERARWEPEVARAVFGGTVRLPARVRAEELEGLGPLPEWRDHPMLKHTRVVELDEHRRGLIPGWELHYDDELGLTEERPR